MSSQTKLALVVPSSGLQMFGYYPPLNLAGLASYVRLKKPHVIIRIIDGVVGMNVAEELADFEPDIVGVTATTPQAPSAYALGDMLKQNRPDVLTVIGGVHCSALPEEALEHFDCEFWMKFFIWMMIFYG